MDTAQATESSKDSGCPTPCSNSEMILSRARAVLKAEGAAIADALSRLDGAFVDAALAIQRTKGRVCVTGVGKAGLIGRKIQATLASTGTLAFALHPVEALHGDLGMIHPDDVILALSKSGSSELIELLPRLKALGCQAILLTASPDSPAAQHADFVLDIGRVPEACPLGLAPSSSTTAMLALGDALALTVMELKAVDPEQYATYHPGGALGRILMKTGEIMRTGANCPTVQATVTLAECHKAILDAPTRAGAACIVDSDGRLQGIVTHGDFFRLFASGMPATEQRVADVMTRSPKRIAVDARVTEALTLMHHHAIDELPVVDDRDQLVGLIDIQDLLAQGYSMADTA